MKKIAFIYSNINFKNKIEYSINTIFMNYDVDIEIFNVSQFKDSSDVYDVIIYYGKEEPKIDIDLIIFEGSIFGDKYLQLNSMPKKVQYINNLPVFFYNSEYECLLLRRKNTLILNNDVIQTVFFFLTCYEDYVVNSYDKYGRFNIENSILFKNNLISTPVVNQTIDYFITLLNKEFNIKISLKNFWGKNDFAVILSHDVDAISKFLPLEKEIRLQLSILLADRKPKLFFRRFLEYFVKSLNSSYFNSYDTFDYILSLEKKYNYKSSFYLMTDNKTYYISDKKIGEITEKIIASGCEIGFHPGLGTSDNKEKFINQNNEFIEKLNFDHKHGVRQHYLSFKSSITWDIQNDAGIAYDTSVCFPQVAGFKVGYCFPYKVFSLEQDKVLDLWEIPLIVMEGTLIQYMKLDVETFKNYFLELLSQVERYSGVFVLLWHNSAITSEFSPFAKELYEWIHEEFSMRHCLVDSSINVLEAFAKKV